MYIYLNTLDFLTLNYIPKKTWNNWKFYHKKELIKMEEFLQMKLLKKVRLDLKSIEYVHAYVIVLFLVNYNIILAYYFLRKYYDFNLTFLTPKCLKEPKIFSHEKKIKISIYKNNVNVHELSKNLRGE